MKGQQSYMFHLLNGLRAYHWGSVDAITRLLGHEDATSPQAELWLGAHPGNPSREAASGVGLDELIQADPARFLGEDATGRFGQLPFLMKVLAAEQPLSIQVHPSLEQARAGFAREDRAGIARDAPERNYRDSNHKPEMLYTLGEFVALSGFRTPDEVLADLRLLHGHLSGSARDTCAELIALLRDGTDPLGQALRLILADGERIEQLARDLVAAIDASKELSAHRQLAEVAWAAGFYPGDPGVLVVLLMNVLRLEAGQAIALGAGKIHAYLRGIGIEVMANSDNVLRGGLTSKHVDVPELLSVTSTTPGMPHCLAPRRLGEGNELYTADCEEFQLQVLQFPGSLPAPAQRLEVNGGAIALCTSGGFELSGSGEQLRVSRGQSVFLPAGPHYTARTADAGPCTLFVASTQAPGRADESAAAHAARAR